MEKKENQENNRQIEGKMTAHTTDKTPCHTVKKSGLH